MKSQKTTHSMKFNPFALKAIALVAFIIVLGQLKAQNIQLFNGQGPVTNGTVLTFADTFSAPEIIAYVWVHNSDNRSHDIRCKKIANDTVVGSLNYFCWGQCYPASVYVSDPVAIAGGDTNKYDFSGDYYPNGHAGTSIITYVFFDDANSNDSAWFVAHFNAFDPNNIDAKNSKPLASSISLRSNVVNESIFIKINNLAISSNALLRIIDVTGSTIKEIPVFNGNSELIVDASYLIQGMYFITFVQNNQKFQTLKFIKQ